MANEEHIKVLKRGMETWNEWRLINPDIHEPDLSEEDLCRAQLFEANLSRADLGETYLIQANLRKADLSRANLSEADLSGADLMWANLFGASLFGVDLSEAVLIEANFREADLRRANFRGADLTGADFRGADLSEANLGEANLGGGNLIRKEVHMFCFIGNEQIEVEHSRADFRGANLSKTDLRRIDFRGADLSGADLSGTDLSGANLSEANLSGANLSGVDLCRASLVSTDFTNALLIDCQIYGISAWDVCLDGTTQRNLNISPDNQNAITVDDLEVAQFIYLLLNNKKIRKTIDIITSKVVLILGRFSDRQKPILNAIREKLTVYDYVPVLFDFDKPSSLDFIETVSTLAHMARFVIADCSEARIVIEEIPHIVRNISVPVVPILRKGELEPITLHNLRVNQRSLTDTFLYTNEHDLFEKIEESIIKPAEEKAIELFERKKPPF